MKKYLLFIVAMLCALLVGVVSACGTTSDNSSDINTSSSGISDTADSLPDDSDTTDSSFDESGDDSSGEEQGGFYLRISTLEELRAISGTSGYYILANDIDACNATYANTTFLGDFAGVLDGNGYSIKNVKIQTATQYYGAGLFGTLSGTIRNIGFENITMLGGHDGTFGRSGFIAQYITGKVLNVYLTGRMENGVVAAHGSWSADYRYGIVAYDAVGATVYNVRAHIDGMVEYSSSLVAKTAPTHWGNYYASYTGTVSHKYGTEVVSDLGGTCFETSKVNGDILARSQGFENTSQITLTADVAPYISNFYWDMDAVTLKENFYNL